MVKISVVIPVYNVENYLRQCLDSVTNQTFKDIEIICVNDGSTDNSLNILKEYEQKDSRIKIINQENQGLGAARNTGVKESSGEYLYFVDSDDWLDLTCLEKCYKQLLKTNADVCFLGLINYYENDKSYKQTNYHSTKCYQVAKKEIFTYKDIKNCIFMRFGAFLKMYKRSYFIEQNLYFAENVFFEDVVSHVKTVLNAKKLTFIEEDLYYYRRRSSSIMTSEYTKAKCDDVLLFIEQIKNLIEEKKIYNTLKYEFKKFFIEQAAFHYNKCSNECKDYFKNLIKNFIKENKFSDNITQEIFRYDYKISVIIPVFNTEKYLRECLDSAINQTLQDIEIICINDGSEDNSLSLLKEYSSKDKRVKIIDQKHKGAGTARNNALKIATGKYIYFFDSDDILELNALEILFNKCEKYNLDMLSFAGNNFDTETKEILCNPYYNFEYIPKNWNKECFNYLDAKSFIQKMAVSTCLTIYKKELLDKYSITFPDGLCFEDNIFFIKALTNAQKISIEKTMLYKRRIHSESITQNWDKNFDDYLKFRIWYYLILKRYELINEFIRHTKNHILTSAKNSIILLIKIMKQNIKRSINLL